MTWYWRLTCIPVSKTTPEDHLIILRKFLAGNKAHATSSSIRVWVNYSRASVKLHLSCTVFVFMTIAVDLQQFDWCCTWFLNGNTSASYNSSLSSSYTPCLNLICISFMPLYTCTMESLNFINLKTSGCSTQVQWGYC